MAHKPVRGNEVCFGPIINLSVDRVTPGLRGIFPSCGTMSESDHFDLNSVHLNPCTMRWHLEIFLVLQKSKDELITLELAVWDYKFEIMGLLIQQSKTRIMMLFYYK